MSAQSQSINNLSGSSASFVQDSAKGKKEIDAQVVAAAAVLQDLRQVLGSSQKGEKEEAALSASSYPNLEGPSNDEMADSMGRMVILLQQLVLVLAKATQNKSNLELGMSDAQIKSLRQNYADIINQIKKIDEEKAQRSVSDIFTKIIQGILAVVGAAVACLLGQPEIAVAIVVLTVLSLTGAMDKLTSAIAGGIKDLLVAGGMDADEAGKVADLIARVLVVVIVIVATLGAGAIAGAAASAAGAVEEVGIELTEVGGNAAEEAAQAAGDGSQNIFSQALSKLKDFFQGLSKLQKVTLMVGSQTILQENPAQAFIAALPIKDDTTKEVLEVLMTIIQDLICAIGSLGALSGGAASASTSALGSKISNFLADYMPKLSTLFKAETFFQGVGAIPQGMTAVTYGEQAAATAAIAGDSRDLELSQFIMGQITSGEKSGQRYMKSLFQEFGQMNSRSGSDLSAGARELAMILAERAV